MVIRSFQVEVVIMYSRNLLFSLSPSALLHPSSGTSLLSPTVSHRPRLWSTLGTRNLDFTLVKPSPRGTLGNWKLETWSVMAMGPKDVGSVRKLGNLKPWNLISEKHTEWGKVTDLRNGNWK